MPTLPIAPADRDVYSVGRLNKEVRMLLEHGMPTVWIEGEISNFSRPASGHWYFTLKDRASQVRCAMFRGRNALLRFAPADGQRVIARARVTLFEPRGEYQLQVEHLEDSGVGALRREYERLKARLEAEGLFDASKKRPLPTVPGCIGVVTSPTGAAIRDILNILGRRFPAARVIIYPTAVQGRDAVPQLLEALSLATTRHECDVLIVARGGGSIEDLWVFNDETVARAIRSLPMPVVTGIGHEVDFTIADFVADLRAPTPSGAAELVVPDGATWRTGFARLAQRLLQALRRQLRNDSDYLVAMRRRLALAHPGQRLRQNAQRLDELEQRLGSRVQLLLSDRRHRLQTLTTRLARTSPKAEVQRLTHRHAVLDERLRRALPQRLEVLRQTLGTLARTLDAVSPLATLDRGFALVTRVTDGALLRDAGAVDTGDLIDTRLAKGTLRARVVEHLGEKKA